MVRSLFLRNGIYTFRKMIDGKQYCRSTGFRDLALAERRAMEIEIEIRKEGLGWTKPPVVTFKQWTDRYARSYGLRKRTARRDRDILGHALPLWAKRPIDSITRSDCVAYMHQRENEGAKAWTVVREMGFLKAVFNAAIVDGLLRANPWTGIKRPRTEARSRVLTTDEQAALLAVLNDEYQRLLTVALGTGLREAELLGLRLHDIDRKAGIIRVRAETAKGAKSRSVPLVPAVEDAIDEQARVNARGDLDRLWSQSGSAVWKCVSAAAKRAKIEPLCVHDFRRTFGTRCAIAGMPLPQLQAIMGHHSPTVTMKYYVHVQEGDLCRALNRVELGLPPAGRAKVVAMRQRGA
jgi:integrase